MISAVVGSLLAWGAAILGVVGIAAIITQLVVGLVKIVTATIVTLIKKA